MFSRINSVGLVGLNAFPVFVEIESSKGLPSFDIVGQGDMVVRESRERIKSAFRTSEFKFPLASLMINLAPADIKKMGSTYDFAIAVALLQINQMISENAIDKTAFVGELSLNGEVRAVKGVLPMVIKAKEQGIKRIYVPFSNGREGSVVSGIEVVGVKTLREFVQFANGEESPRTMGMYTPEATDYFGDLDFADVKGQESTKRALEISACGGHNVLMIGTPGSGKSMLAKRMPSILPPMTFEESIETTNIHSIADKLDPNSPLITKRPFRSPHHTISSSGLSGGGTIPKPGEISLAHNGLLFLDELAEFSRPTIEVLRQPLEDQKVTISRVAGSITYPCSLMLIGTMNPCPCGYYGHPTRNCTCKPTMVSKYLSKISGPMLDRFDIHVEVSPVVFDEISSVKKEESSERIRERVIKAREIQLKRFKGTGITCNARITSEIIRDVCQMTDGAVSILKKVFEKMGLSARAYDRILKVSRTIADMEQSEIIDRRHIAQAVQYRSLDRKYWA